MKGRYLRGVAVSPLVPEEAAGTAAVVVALTGWRAEAARLGRRCTTEEMPEMADISFRREKRFRRGASATVAVVLTLGFATTDV